MSTCLVSRNTTDAVLLWQTFPKAGPCHRCLSERAVQCNFPPKSIPSFYTCPLLSKCTTCANASFLSSLDQVSRFLGRPYFLGSLRKSKQRKRNQRKGKPAERPSGRRGAVRLIMSLEPPCPSIGERQNTTIFLYERSRSWGQGLGCPCR
jgi:hypothetical protein